MLSRKERRIYGEVLKNYRPTIRTLLLQILEQKLFNLKRGKESVYVDGAKFFPEHDRIARIPLTYIAVVNDGTVQEMIRVNEEAAKLLLNKGTKLVQFDPTQVVVKKGMKYNKGLFIEQVQNDETNTI